jgi:hypothetical protein
MSQGLVYGSLQLGTMSGGETSEIAGGAFRHVAGEVESRILSDHEARTSSRTCKFA